MFVFVFEARLFKFTYREPSSNPLFQLPPTIAFCTGSCAVTL